VREVVVRREVVGSHGERAFAKSKRAAAAAHAVRIVRAIFRVPAQQEELDIKMQAKTKMQVLGGVGCWTISDAG
jgi:hypothetical protein